MRRVAPLLLLSLALPAALAAPAARAGSARVPPSRDATLVESATGALANGAGSYLFVGRTSQTEGSRRRALLSFDLAGQVPRGAVVSSARLVLGLTPSHAGASELRLHRVLAPWSEGPASAEGGGGAAASTGDATWLHSVFDQRLWASPGGDFASLPSAISSVENPGSYAWSSPELAADVQHWLDEPGANHGWILIGAEGAPTTSKRFASREHPDAELRPVLEIEFGRRLGACADGALAGEALALCAAYCEALDCAGEAPRGSAVACERLAERFARAVSVPLPCTFADLDGDGVADESDNCVAAANSGQADGDADAVGDACDNCPAVANPDQQDAFGELGLGDACDCPCFTSVAVAALVLTLQDPTTYRDLLCIDTRAGKPLTAVTALRSDGAPCATASNDCSALSVEFTEDRACQWNPPAPGLPAGAAGISDPQREACRQAILAGAEPLGLPCD